MVKKFPLGKKRRPREFRNTEITDPVLGQNTTLDGSDIFLVALSVTISFSDFIQLIYYIFQFKKFLLSASATRFHLQYLFDNTFRKE